MMLTHGNISRTIKFLVGLRRGMFSSLHDFCLLERCKPEERLRIERFCETCRLTRLSNDATDMLTELGTIVADDYYKDSNHSAAFRHLLEVYIVNERPGWGYRMPVGRSETFAALTKDERFCFQESGLAQTPVCDDVVVWWDRVSASFRSEDDVRKLDIGRKGERLTLRYELMRTGREAKWVSVESNFAGYDILSSRSSSDDTSRLIEVKASEKPIYESVFYVSRNEWNTAKNSQDRYWFYLWHLAPVAQLAIVPSAEVGKHISRNQGSGSWCSVEVPFSVFSNFTAINFIKQHQLWERSED